MIEKLEKKDDTAKAKARKTGLCFKTVNGKEPYVSARALVDTDSKRHERFQNRKR